MNGPARWSWIAWLAAATAGACSTAEYEPEQALAAAIASEASERLVVLVLGDGFVRTGDRRIPLELLVLELRQRTRSMTAGQRAGLCVAIGLAPDGGEQAVRDAERLLDQLQVMGVGMATYL
jgi:hypothetical protein